MDYGDLSSMKTMGVKSAIYQRNQPVVFVHAFEMLLLICGLNLLFEPCGVVSIRRGDSYPTQTSTTEGTNVHLKDLGPWTGQQGSSFFFWTSLGFSTNPKTHFVTPWMSLSTVRHNM